MYLSLVHIQLLLSFINKVIMFSYDKLIRVQLYQESHNNNKSTYCKTSGLQIKSLNILSIYMYCHVKSYINPPPPGHYTTSSV